MLRRGVHVVAVVHLESCARAFSFAGLAGARRFSAAEQRLLLTYLGRGEQVEVSACHQVRRSALRHVCHGRLYRFVQEALVPRHAASLNCSSSLLVGGEVERLQPRQVEDVSLHGVGDQLVPAQVKLRQRGKVGQGVPV